MFYTQFLEAFEAYFFSQAMVRDGLPSVKTLADALGISEQELQMALVQETGQDGNWHLEQLVLKRAQAQLANSQRPIREIGFELGFGVPREFTRFFKGLTGLTPSAYRRKERLL